MAYGSLGQPAPCYLRQLATGNIPVTHLYTQCGWHGMQRVNTVAGLPPPGRRIGAIGYSVLAALAHMTGQFVLAWLLFIPHLAIWHLFPVMLTAALLFGIVSGIIARTMCNNYTPCKT